MIFNISTFEVADAVTAKVRTADWRLVVNNTREVIYYSDFDAVNGTQTATVYVGL